ncbi:MAG: hypothetical protein U0894_13820 [Pirellulales bacterium]
MNTSFSLSLLLLGAHGDHAATAAIEEPVAEAMSAQVATLWTMGIVVGVGLLVAGGYWLYLVWLKRRDWQASQDPWHLFRQLCTAHQLNKSQVRLLKRLAKQDSLASPIPLFLEPERLRKIAKGTSAKREQTKIQDLAKVLFGALASA